MKDLIARLREPWRMPEKKPPVMDEAADALEAQAKEIEALKSRLEIDPRHHVDGIYARDATIKLLENEIEALRADAERYRWLREYWTRIVSYMDTPFDIRFEVSDKHWGTLPPDVIDAATDAARRK